MQPMNNSRCDLGCQKWRYTSQPRRAKTSASEEDCQSRNSLFGRTEERARAKPSCSHHLIHFRRSRCHFSLRRSPPSPLPTWLSASGFKSGELRLSQTGRRDKELAYQPPRNKSQLIIHWCGVLFTKLYSGAVFNPPSSRTFWKMEDIFRFQTRLLSAEWKSIPQKTNKTHHHCCFKSLLQ